MTMEFIQITTTVPDEATARAVAHALVERRVAACVQVLGPIHSLYRWQGQVESSTEYQCIAKSMAAQFDQVVATIRELHPYEVPEIIGVSLSHVSHDYGAWMKDATQRR